MPIILGVDVGQAVDPTAIVALDSYVPEPMHIDDRPEKHHLIRWLEKIPLGTHYEQVVNRIVAIGEDASSIDHTRIVIDATGVGRPIVDMLRARTRTSVLAVTFTGGASETETDPYTSRVPKRDLVTALEVVLQGRRLHAVPGLSLVEDLRAELSHFEVNISSRGHDTYDGASGKHDDLVMALCLATWAATRGSSAETWINVSRRWLDRARSRQHGSLDAPLTRELT
jgi:hypothetical protein